MTPWTFGEVPLPQTVEASALVRRVTALLLAQEHEEGSVAELLRHLREAEAALERTAPRAPEPRIGAASSGDGRVYVDHARDIGGFNPCFPEYRIEVDGDRADGTVAFPLPYEGPPGVVHGGFLAVFFDCVVQHHNCDVGVAGKTTSLQLRFRRPVPLSTPLSFALERTVSDGRIHSAGILQGGDVVLCEASIDAVAGDRANLPEVSPRRGAGG